MGCKYEWIEAKLFTGHQYVINNGIILSIAKHPFMKFVVDYVNNLNIQKTFLNMKELYISNATGPFMITNAYFDSPEKLQHMVKVLEPEFFEPCSPYEKECKYTVNTYIDHQHELTWVAKPLQFFLQIYLILRKYKFLLLIIILLFFYRFFYRFLYKNN